MTIPWDLGATGTNTIGTEIPLTSHLTQPFTPQLALTGGARIDVQPRANYGPEVGPQNGGNANYTFTSGMSAELPRGAASGSNASVAPVDESGATRDVRMTQDMQMGIELASCFPSPSTLDLIVVAGNAESSHPHAVIKHSLYTSE